MIVLFPLHHTIHGPLRGREEGMTGCWTQLFCLSPSSLKSKVTESWCQMGKDLGESWVWCLHLTKGNTQVGRSREGQSDGAGIARPCQPVAQLELKSKTFLSSCRNLSPGTKWSGSEIHPVNEHSIGKGGATYSKWSCTEVGQTLGTSGDWSWHRKDRKQQKFPHIIATWTKCLIAASCSPICSRLLARHLGCTPCPFQHRNVVLTKKSKP